MPTEPLLVADSRRFSLYPIKCKKLWDFYKRLESSFWIPSEVDLSQDRADFQTLPAAVQQWLRFILAWFNIGDALVASNLNVFSSEVENMECKAFFGMQTANEGVHAETYSMLIDTLIEDPEEKNALFEAVEHMPSIAAKAAWTQQWTDPTRASFAMRLVAWACTEWILFSTSFASIFYIKYALAPGKLPGLTFSNELISRDEGLHCEFACEVYRMLKYPLDESVVKDIIKGAVAVEQAFVQDALRLHEDLPGMSQADMCAYVEFVADRLLEMLSCAPCFHTPLPDALRIMDAIGAGAGVSKSNFFERRNSAYSIAKIQKPAASAASSAFQDDADF